MVLEFTAKEIFEDARTNLKPQNLFKEGNIYNTAYMLSAEEIHAAAIWQIGKKLNITPNEAAKQYLIYPIGLKSNDNFSQITDDIKDVIQTAKNKDNPSFIIFSQNDHHVTIALVPEKTKPNLSVVYINSELTEEHLSNVGKSFASLLAQDLNNDANFMDISEQQQYDNCCGLSVASNIAAIATYFDKNKNIDQIKFSIPYESKEQRKYYQEFGAQSFNAIKNIDLDFNKVPLNTDDKELIGDLTIILAKSSDQNTRIESLKLLMEIAHRSNVCEIRNVMEAKFSVLNTDNIDKNKSFYQKYNIQDAVQPINSKAFNKNDTEFLNSFKDKFPDLHNILQTKIPVKQSGSNQIRSITSKNNSRGIRV